MKIQNTNNRFGVRTNLRAGSQFGDLGEFVTRFMENSLTSSDRNPIQDGLDITNEECKKARGDRKCDEWASYFTGLIVKYG